MPISKYVILGLEVHEQMFRLGNQSDSKPPVLSSQASLVLIYRPTEEIKAEFPLPSPRFETSTRGAEARSTTTQPLGSISHLTTSSGPQLPGRGLALVHGSNSTGPLNRLSPKHHDRTVENFCRENSVHIERYGQLTETYRMLKSHA
ncbi:hypothetical protein TNCV_1325451 [Trichonephila clavipes]|nr:hypothetical protein TNCV_1325451 [Trichonephila clavipes]